MNRLWVDANVLLRYLTGEPPAQAARAARLMARAEAGDVSIYVAPLVLAEVVWVLKSFYGHPMTVIRETLVPLVGAPGIEVDDVAIVVEALELAADRNVDFIDAFLAVQAAAAGETVCTFDVKDFRRLPATWVAPE